MIGTATQECFPTLRSSSASATKRVGIVERGRVRRTLDEEQAERVVVVEAVHLVGRAPLLPVRKLAGVDDHPQCAGVGLPPRDGERLCSDRGPGLLGSELGEIVELVDGGHGGRDRDQRVQLALEPTRITVALGWREEIGEIGLDCRPARPNRRRADSRAAPRRRRDRTASRRNDAARRQLRRPRAPRGTADRRRAR